MRQQSFHKLIPDATRLKFSQLMHDPETKRPFLPDITVRTYQERCVKNISQHCEQDQAGLLLEYTQKLDKLLQARTENNENKNHFNRAIASAFILMPEVSADFILRALDRHKTRHENGIKKYADGLDQIIKQRKNRLTAATKTPEPSPQELFISYVFTNQQTLFNQHGVAVQRNKIVVSKFHSFIGICCSLELFGLNESSKLHETKIRLEPHLKELEFNFYEDPMLIAESDDQYVNVILSTLLDRSMSLESTTQPQLK